MMRKAVLLLFLSHFSASVAHGADPPEVDSTLMAYYTHINRHIREPWILQSADTLFRLAGEKGDVRMQAVARTFKADHYYYTGQLDSLKAWIPRVQRFARENGQLKYYYFVWTRLVTYSIKQGQYARAILELEHILRQAAKDDYKDATASAYTQLGHIYRTKSLHRQAVEYYRRAIDYIEQNDLDGFSLTTLYCNLITELYEDPQNATDIPSLLDRAEAHAATPSQEVSVKRLRTLHCLRTGQYAKAAQLIAQFKEAAAMKRPSVSEIQLLELELIHAKNTGALREAKRLADEVIDRSIGEGTDPTFFTFYYVTRAQVNRQLGDYKDAYEDLSTAYSLHVKKSSKDTSASLDEFASLLGVEQLARENAELEKAAQEQQLKRVRITVFALIGILLLCTVFIWAQWRLTRRLAAAKRAAEEADRMKGIFIRNVTHEINTPLNSVVGFAQIASAAGISAEERTSYLNIMEENSSYLRKLVDDVLCISDLETASANLPFEPADIDACCLRSIEKACPPGSPGPSVAFRPDGRGLRFATSAFGIVQVLANLLHNARKFSPDGRVELAWSHRENAGGGNTLIFTVTDTGCGIPPTEAEHIFERFVKLDPFAQGLGLGLAVCRLVASRMNGQVRLDTSYTQGSRFVFTVSVA